jgi:CRISPR-associated protein Csm4
MKELIVHIKPKSAFSGALHSDTLFGALCVAIRHVYGESFLLELLESFKDAPPFLVSSAFPYVATENGRVHFFPKPIEDYDRRKDFWQFLDRAKALKRTHFISEDLFLRWIAGQRDAYLIENFDELESSMGLLYHKQDLAFNIRPITVWQNQVNRLSMRLDKIFHFEGWLYDNAGLFFLVRIFRSEMQSVIGGALTFLSDRGFGRDVSTGKGHFELENITQRTPFASPVAPDHFVTLSRYCPTQEEAAAFTRRRDSFYHLEAKRGRTASGVVKRLVRYFAEGSTFPSLGRDFYGTMVDVHSSAFQFGFSFPVRIV